MSRVLLLFGGRSAEHEVSCVSAVAIYDALVEGGHRVIPVGIDRSGQWWVVDASHRPFHAEGRAVELRIPDGRLMVGGDDVGYDVVFPAIHGPYGEDGTIQGVFETVGKPYVGCGVLPSALAMDKDVAKRTFAAAGLSTSRWRVVRRDGFRSDPDGISTRLLRELGSPVFVKPAELGSSVGISKADSGNWRGQSETGWTWDDRCGDRHNPYSGFNADNRCYDRCGDTGERILCNEERC